jgi:chromatin remodeling complex protein RSC6
MNLPNEICKRQRFHARARYTSLQPHPGRGIRSAAAQRALPLAALQIKGDVMAKTAKKKGAGRKPNAAFMKPVTPSDALAEVVGPKPLPRTEVTKKLWAYIKKNGLQDSKNRRMIKSDATLKPIFGGKPSVNMFEMTKLVGKHLK